MQQPSENWGGSISSSTWVPLDKTEALLWYKKAASQGDVETQLALGGIYYTGIGVKANHAEAIMYYIKASEQGSVKASVMLKKWETTPETTETQTVATTFEPERPEHKQTRYLFKQ